MSHKTHKTKAHSLRTIRKRNRHLEMGKQKHVDITFQVETRELYSITLVLALTASMATLKLVRLIPHVATCHNRQSNWVSS